MHEASLMQCALDMALEQARLHRATRIHRITLRIGRLAGVVPEALAFAFDVVTAGTIAEGARLEVEAVAIVCYCAGCREEFTPPDFVFACPRCGSLSADVRAGQELELARVEVSADGEPS